MNAKNLFYGQAGGVTAVINATAAAVIRAARRHPARIGTVLAGRFGVLGALREDLLETATLDEADLDALANRPGGAFGACRFDLDREEDDARQYDRLFEVFAAHDIGYFLYNGGNGSMDVVARVSASARRRGYPLVCVGVPKTIDNDLEGTDCSPGFGSAAKYLATSMRECGQDLASMTSSVGRVFVMEVMGRNVGWLAAATALAARDDDEPPHIVLLPEVAFDENAFLARVEAVVARIGYCAITVSEGIRDAAGQAVVELARDAAGYVQLGGAGQHVARLIHARHGYKYHVAVPDYQQRAAAHLVSAQDHAQACAVGEHAVQYALEGHDGTMASIRRLGSRPYRWEVAPVPVAQVANLERAFPAAFIRTDGLQVTDEARAYLQPLIEGERPVPFAAGVPDYRRLVLDAVPRRLPAFEGRGGRASTPR